MLMRKTSLVLICVMALSSLLGASAGVLNPIGDFYRFDGGLKTKVDYFDTQSIKLRVFENREHYDSYPVGTIFVGRVLSHRRHRKPALDEVYRVRLDQAILPNSEIIKFRKLIKIKPEDYISNVWKGGSAAFLSAGIALGITVDVASLGLPIGRGGLAAWIAAQEAYNSPEHKSKTKAAAKGFLRGALFPLSLLVVQGDALNIHPGSVIILGKDNPQPNGFVKLKRWFAKLLLKDKTHYISASLIKRDN